jgi:hypothetical protein
MLKMRWWEVVGDVKNVVNGVLEMVGVVGGVRGCECAECAECGKCGECENALVGGCWGGEKCENLNGIAEMKNEI